MKYSYVTYCFVSIYVSCISSSIGKYCRLAGGYSEAMTCRKIQETLHFLEFPKSWSGLLQANQNGGLGLKKACTHNRLDSVVDTQCGAPMRLTN